MNRKWFPFLAVPALATGMIFAQAPGTPSPSQQAPVRQHQRFQRGQRAQKLAQFLNLTDAQKEQAKSILQQSRQSTRAIAQQLRQDRQEMMQAVKANDTARIQQLASSEGNLMGQLQAARSTAFAKIYNTVLTPEQRTKADQLPSMFRQWRANHGQHGRANG